MAVDIEAINARVREQARALDAVREEIARVIVGQERLVNRLLVALLCRGHVLLEGVPGLAKTLSVSTLAGAIDAAFVRIQFTPDLLPADLIGTLVFNPRDGEFHVRKGPIFANIVLADEVNRAPAKVQSALLEAMQERQVSIGGTTFPLDEPFMVLATQNPIEHEGTYPLPEAQLDRFMLKALVDYPSRAEEQEVMERFIDREPESFRGRTRAVINAAGVLTAQQAVTEVRIEPPLKDYILHLVRATRDPEPYRLGELKPLIAYGASPRASIYLARAARANAFLDGRGYVLPEDIKELAPDVFRHRVVVTYEAEAESVTAEEIVRRALGGVPLP